jgi:hypothetical protein
MVEDQRFLAKLEEIIGKYKISHFFETGTNLGLGSTTMLANSILKTGVKVEEFYTVERDPFFHEQASKNLKGFKFVTPLLGLSVLDSEALQFLENDPALKNHSDYPDIFIDDIIDPVAFYIKEIKGNLSGQNSNSQVKTTSIVDKLKDMFSSPNKTEKVSDGLIDIYVEKIADNRPLFLLDSAGGIGYLEFLKVVSIMKNRPFFLILDDTHHIKHWRSREDVFSNSEFSVLYDDISHGRTIAGFKIN